jgi:uncharacterized protein with von Willebrand factor type A (vWA) domain
MKRNCLGGVIHTYQKYDPQRFPGPTQTPPDLVSHAFDHLLAYGGFRELTEDELARAVRLDPSQIAGLGPSLDALVALLLERRRRILETYESDSVQQRAAEAFQREAVRIKPPLPFRRRFQQSVAEEQIYELERLWYSVRDDASPFARQLVSLIQKLGEKYEIDEMAAKYRFTGRTSLTVEEGLEVKAELDRIAELLDQLERARRTAQIGLIDLEALAEFAEPGDLSELSALRQQIEDYIRQLASQQGLEQAGSVFRLTPKAYRLFQSRLLERIFGPLQASRTGRHKGPIAGEGAVELQATKAYEFGDSLAHIDLPQSFLNSMLRQGVRLPVQLEPRDIEIHRTRNSPKCATVVIMDMSGSMRYDAQYINVKRMALALDGLIRREYPGDFLGFVEMYSFAKRRQPGEIVELLPRPVTIHDPWVRLKYDMSRPDISEFQVFPHFTNIQHGLQTARRLLSVQETLNRQVVLITDGLPTAHFQGSWLYLLYPPDPSTEAATMRESHMCQREGIRINIFLVPSWSQDQEDIRFAHRMAAATGGRVFFTAGRDLDRFVLWDYVARRRELIG